MTLTRVLTKFPPPSQRCPAEPGPLPGARSQTHGHERSPGSRSAPLTSPLRSHPPRRGAGGSGKDLTQAGRERGGDASGTRLPPSGAPPGPAAATATPASRQPPNSPLVSLCTSEQAPQPAARTAAARCPKSTMQPSSPAGAPEGRGEPGSGAERRAHSLALHGAEGQRPGCLAGGAGLGAESLSGSERAIC